MSISIAGLIKIAQTNGEPLFKGDIPGHEFHGNQYTESSGTAKNAKEWNGKDKLEAGHIVHLAGEGSQKYKVLEATDAKGDMPRILVEAQNTGMRLAPTERVSREHVRAPK